jgi:intracellular proteinase inhibitor BsuPI
MKRGLSLFMVVMSLTLAQVRGQEETPAASTEANAPEPVATRPSKEEPIQHPTPTPAKRSLFGRILHPFSSGPRSDTPPQYKDLKLRGLTFALQLSPETVKLSEVRQLEIRATLTNRGKREVEMDFVNDQRIEIYLMNSAEVVLTKWSDNHAISDKAGTVLINPQEHIEYKQSISTRELAPGKVYIAEVFFPKYPELRVRQKFLTAP